ARGAGELPVDAELRLDLLRLVMDERAELALLFARPAADHQHGHALRERAGDRVHHVVPTRAVGDAHDADPSRGACVAVGREADARLVRERDDLEPARLPEAREQPQYEIARDAEEVRDADLLEVGDPEVADRDGHAARAEFKRRARTRGAPRA